MIPNIWRPMAPACLPSSFLATSTVMAISPEHRCLARARERWLNTWSNFHIEFCTRCPFLSEILFCEAVLIKREYHVGRHCQQLPAVPTHVHSKADSCCYIFSAFLLFLSRRHELDHAGSLLACLSVVCCARSRLRAQPELTRNEWWTARERARWLCMVWHGMAMVARLARIQGRSIVGKSSNFPKPTDFKRV